MEEAKRYGVDVSEVLRNALEEEVKREEEEEARGAAIRIANELKVSREEVARLIGEDRER
nr:VapB-type antitoxin [Stygiolobus caldivivus]